MASGPADGPVPVFDPEVACCTYIPVLPNHTVGRILRDAPEGPGRDSVLARIHAHVAVTPLGLDWPHWASELYGSDHRGFGTNRRLRCPHHLQTDQGGRCGIWAHRNATCATWFCKHERGETGRAVWMAVRDLLQTVDQTLAWFALDALGVSSERRERLRARPGLLRGALLVDGHPGGEPTPERRRSVWGRWFGKELDFYRQCADVVDSADPDPLHALVSDATRPQRQRLARAVDALNAPLPTAPVRQKTTVLAEHDGLTTLRAYSHYDPVVVPTPLAQQLHVFDGAPLELIAHRLALAGVDYTTLDLRYLVDTQVLGPPQL